MFHRQTFTKIWLGESPGVYNLSAMDVHHAQRLTRSQRDRDGFGCGNNNAIA
jgi:hypothetical protein